jgi:copper homeostasis protein
MIRPHAGPFIFDAADEAAMMADIDAVRAFGLAGVVIGANRPDGTLDMPLMHRLKAHAAGLGSTLHRAFDLVPDPDVALEQAVELGCERILTSGCVPKAIDGLDTLAPVGRRPAAFPSCPAAASALAMSAKSCGRRARAKFTAPAVRRSQLSIRARSPSASRQPRPIERIAA